VGTARRDDTTAAGAKVDDVTINMAGVQYRLGAITLFASMYDGEDKNTGVAGVATTEKRDLSGVQLAASYALSKRTSAYFVTGKNEDKGAVAGSNYKNEGTAIGVRHNF
jgi:predicted porin